MQPLKVNIFYLFRLLTEFSDETHILTTTQILELLNGEYGIKIERRSVYAYINTLMFLGADISTYDDNGKGYYLRSRYLDESEIRMLIYGLYLNPECDKASFHKITQKLQGILSRNKRKKYMFEKKRNTVSEKNAGLLLHAADNGMRVTFSYTEYKIKDGDILAGERVCEADVISVRPVAGEFLAECENADGRSFISSTQMHNLSLAGAAEKKEYNSKGNDGIIIRCEESAADALLHEYFGKARIMTNKNGSFTAVINTDAESFEPWAMRHLRECEVLEPYELRERITESIRRSGYLK